MSNEFLSQLLQQGIAVCVSFYVLIQVINLFRKTRSDDTANIKQLVGLLGTFISEVASTQKSLAEMVMQLKETISMAIQENHARQDVTEQRITEFENLTDTRFKNMEEQIGKLIEIDSKLTDVIKDIRKG